MRHRWSERGSATVLAIALGAVIVGAGIILLTVLQLAIVRAELGSYADLAALSASGQGSRSCQAAAQVAHMNQVELVGCEINSGEVEVSVRFVDQGSGLIQWLARNLEVSARATNLSASFR